MVEAVNAIELKNITKRFGEKVIANDSVNLTVRKGESVLSESVLFASMLPLRSMTLPSKAIASARVVFPVPGAPIRTMFLISFAE